MSKDKSELSEQDLERLVRFDDELRGKRNPVDDTIARLSDADDTAVDSSEGSDALTVEMDSSRLKREEQSVRVESTESCELPSLDDEGVASVTDSEIHDRDDDALDDDALDDDALDDDDLEPDELVDDAVDEQLEGTGAKALAFIHRVQESNPHVVDDMAAEEVNGWLHIEGEHPKRLGKHEIIRRLGSGGFGVVFLAIDPELDREVALKVPRVETLINGQTRRRFLRESRMAAQLNHPNIATIFEAGTVGPVFYIASEHCPGGSIDQYLQIEAKGGRLDPLATAHVIRELADAVDHAHARGILHRDIKPSNILLDLLPEELTKLNENPQRMGEVARLVDFGLAKSLEISDDVTKSGIMLGTPAFTAPEMVTRREEAGVEADIYSLGATMYHLLTGSPPLKKASDFETLVATQNEEPDPPSSVVKDLHRDLDAICLKCLEKQPQDRYADAGELRNDLDRFISGRAVSARSTTRLEKVARWCRRNSMVVVLATCATLLLGIAAGSVIYALQYASHLRQESLQIDRERLDFNIHSAFDQDLILGNEIQRELWQSESELPTYDLSQDGRVLLIGFGDRISFWDILERKQLNTLSVRSQPARFAQFDSSLLACSSDNVLGRYPIQKKAYDDQIRWQVGKVQEWEGDRVEGTSVIATSLDGNHVATSLRKGMLQLRDLAANTESTVELGERVDSISFSTDSTVVAVALEPIDEVRILSVLDQKIVKSISVNRPKYVSYSPNGQYLAITAGEQVRVFQVSDWSESHEFGNLWSPQFAFSPDTKLLAAATGHEVITLFPMEKTERPDRVNLTIKIPSNLSISQIMFTRDKRFLVAGTEEGVVYIWDLHAAAQNLQPLNVNWWVLSERPSSDPPTGLPITVSVP